MEAVTATDIRASLVNCSKGEATRLAIPRDLAERPWDDLDFLGWRDPSGSDRGCLVAEHGGRLTGVILRCVPASAAGRPAGGRSTMCSLCLTTHPGAGVTLMTAARRKSRDNSVGIRICADLDCSLYLRGKKDPPAGGRLSETLTVEEKAGRLRTSLSAFLDKV
jgi:hypothetical protein